MYTKSDPVYNVMIFYLKQHWLSPLAERCIQVHPISTFHVAFPFSFFPRWLHCSACRVIFLFGFLRYAQSISFSEQQFLPQCLLVLSHSSSFRILSRNLILGYFAAVGEIPDPIPNFRSCCQRFTVVEKHWLHKWIGKYDLCLQWDNSCSPSFWKQPKWHPCFSYPYFYIGLCSFLSVPYAS